MPGSTAATIDTLTITTIDPVADDQGHTKVGVDSIAITIAEAASHVNAASTVQVPADQIATTAVALGFSDAIANAIKVADIDSGFDDVQVTLTVASGTLGVTALAGDSSTPAAGQIRQVPAVTGTGTATLTLTGRLDHINYILQSLTYTSGSGFVGTDTLTITINDQGNSGSDGANSDTKTVNIAVNAP